jgi:hypothetical protein
MSKNKLSYKDYPAGYVCGCPKGGQPDRVTWVPSFHMKSCPARRAMARITYEEGWHLNYN